MRLIGKIAAAALFVVAGGTAASAQSAGSWSGFYIGANIGGGWATADHLPGTGSVTGVNDLSPSGIIAGGQVGFNWMTGSLLFGVQADLDLSGMSASCAQPNCHPPQAPDTQEKINSLASIALRIGMPNGSVLPYVLAGLAGANTTRNTGYQTQSNSKNYGGWTAGAGVEWMKPGGWSWTAQANYYDLGTQTYNFSAGNQPIVHLTAVTVKIGVNKHF
jgi:outer membrane immunogenic protein